jgi:hypothetical protein
VKIDKINRINIAGINPKTDFSGYNKSVEK